MLRRTLNLGILAHVDAGKTTLTERLLYAAGVIDEIGSVDDGTTQTDSLALERQRGITIKTAVVAFEIDDVSVNLIDTPGHPDFIAEVERVLSVLDGAVLVVSAVEGVQAQTRVLMRALERLRIPTLVFVNKIDRRGADYDRVLEDICERLTPRTIAMGAVSGEGTHTAGYAPNAGGDAVFTSRLVDLLADQDAAFLAAYVDDETTVSSRQLRGELAAQTKRALVHPVFFGSAITGAGVDALIAGITELLPAAEGDVDGPVSANIFKVERGPSAEKIAYARVFSGTINVRDRLLVHRDELEQDDEAKVTAISVFDSGLTVANTPVSAGQIGKLWGLADIQIGDTLGEPGSRRSRQHSFAPPTLESVVVPRRPDDKGALHVALTQLAEQDPLINLRQDDERQQTSVSLYGEVQKEVIQATLANDFGIDVDFRETTPIYIERPIGSGAAVEVLGKEANPFLATVGLRVDAAPAASGFEFRVDVAVSSVPLYVYKSVAAFADAVEERVHQTLQQGLYGWEVTDCTVTMTDSGYSSPGTTAADFRKLTPLVVMAALKQARTTVYEPIHRFRLDGPAESLQATMRVLAQLRAEPQAPTRFEWIHPKEVRPLSRRLSWLDVSERQPAAAGGRVSRGLVGAIRPIAAAVIRDGDRILVWDDHDPATGEVVAVPLTGGIEFGETGEQAIARELEEEISATATRIRFLGLLEDIFDWAGQRRHELYLVFAVDLAEQGIYEADEVNVVEPDGTAYVARWRSLSEFGTSARLVPDGLLELIQQSQR